MHPIRVAELILEGHLAYRGDFDSITRNARSRFENADWIGIQRASIERIEIYDKHIHAVVDRLAAAEETSPRIDWQGTKSHYTSLIADLDDEDIAETFFNSVHRKITDDADIDERAMFVHSPFPTRRTFDDVGFLRSFPLGRGDVCAVRRFLEALPFAIPWENVDRDAANVSAVVNATGLAADPDAHLEMLESVFYRNKGAYVVGRIVSSTGSVPLVLPILNNEAGALYVDTAIVDENDVSIVFSFTRSYFMVHTPRPMQLLHFLEQLLPAKKRSELYSSIGFHKHGKTEFYRGFLEHLDRSDDQLVIAPGVKGMVMTVFTLPSYQTVFKIMRDRFAPQKDITREQVRDHYHLVKTHDRVGRMADTQEFSNFSLPRARFSPELIEELLEVAPSSVTLTPERVIIHHLYTERLMQPLNLYIEQADDDGVRNAVDEYGNAIKQLAAANIFPGDMLLKNFGVTRHGRVVFYDYDEICYLTQVNFRHIPEPRNQDEELASEPWYTVARNDVFPQEFRRFLFARASIKKMFTELHGELFDPDYWKELQRAVEGQQVMDVFPYRRSRRFIRESA